MEKGEKHERGQGGVRYALLAVLSVAGLLLFELALSPKARYPLTVTRVQQVQQVLRGEEVQQGEGVLVPYGEERLPSR